VLRTTRVNYGREKALISHSQAKEKMGGLSLADSARGEV